MVSAASQWAGKPQSCGLSDLNGRQMRTQYPDTLTQLCVTFYTFHGLFGSCQVSGSFQVKLHLCAQGQHQGSFLLTNGHPKLTGKTILSSSNYIITFFCQNTNHQMCYGVLCQTCESVSTNLYVCPDDSHMGSCFPQILVKS